MILNVIKCFNKFIWKKILRYLAVIIQKFRKIKRIDTRSFEHRTINKSGQNWIIPDPTNSNYFVIQTHENMRLNLSYGTLLFINQLLLSSSCVVLEHSQKMDSIFWQECNSLFPCSLLVGCLCIYLSSVHMLVWSHFYMSEATTDI